MSRMWTKIEDQYTEDVLVWAVSHRTHRVGYHGPDSTSRDALGAPCPEWVELPRQWEVLCCGVRVD
jgi:hypothetical protein